MKTWRNGAKKRVCDISEDEKVIIIEMKGYKTRITATVDGKLKLENIQGM